MQKLLMVNPTERVPGGPKSTPKEAFEKLPASVIRYGRFDHINT